MCLCITNINLCIHTVVIRTNANFDTYAFVISTNITLCTYAVLIMININFYTDGPIFVIRRNINFKNEFVAGVAIASENVDKTQLILTTICASCCCWLIEIILDIFRYFSSPLS